MVGVFTVRSAGNGGDSLGLRIHLVAAAIQRCDHRASHGKRETTLRFLEIATCGFTSANTHDVSLFAIYAKEATTRTS